MCPKDCGKSDKNTCQTAWDNTCVFWDCSILLCNKTELMCSCIVRLFIQTVAESDGFPLFCACGDDKRHGVYSVFRQSRIRLDVWVSNLLRALCFFFVCIVIILADICISLSASSERLERQSFKFSGLYTLLCKHGVCKIFCFVFERLLLFINKNSNILTINYLLIIMRICMLAIY